MVTEVFLALALIALLGSLLRVLLPELDVSDLRVKLHRLVLAVFLPALNFHVLYRAELGHELWQVPVSALAGVAVCLAAALAIYALVPLPRPVRGSLVLASAFGNVTYLGLPVLRGLFPEAAQQVTTTAILYEATITPTNLVVGSAIAAAFASRGRFSLAASLGQIARLPLLWAIAAAIALNAGGVVVPAFVLRAAALLGDIVPGLMILTLGMALRIEVLRGLGRRAVALVPCLGLKLGLSPLVVFAAATSLGLRDPYFHAAVVEGGMPTQLLVLVVADRFGLDAETLAPAVLLSTVAAFATVPLVHALLVP
jgi:predicted permease